MTLTVEEPSATTEPDSPRARWERPGLLALLASTAVLYLWGLGSHGWGNSFYAAAAQAGTQDWKAWLFGSLDAGNAITVDKPPAAMWVMALSGRLFGFNEFTMLLPQALMGVAAVAVLYFTVRRSAGAAAGLIAGAALAITPVAVAMFRYNNPDALLVLLLVVAAYCMVRATVGGSTRWVALSGTALGFAFLTKMLQAFLVVPGLALVFLIAAPIPFWKRVRSLLAGAAAMVVSAGWYIALVSVWPADSRPYIGGSTDNNLLQLAFGYNGIDRIVGRGQPGGGHGAGPGDPGAEMHQFFGGQPGIGRLFGSAMGTEASWLLPAALLGLVAVLWVTRRAVRTDPVRAAAVLWGGWLLVTGVVFSFMDGTIHPYYTVALAPAVAALVGISVVQLWQRRAHPAARTTLALGLAGTGGWTFVLLSRHADWWPAVRWTVLVASVVLAVAIAVGVQRFGRAGIAVVAAALLAGAGGSVAWSVATVADGGSGGPMATAGPAMQRDMAFPGVPDGPGGPGRSIRMGAHIEDTALAQMVTGLDNRWAAATVGSMLAGDLELKSGASIMAVGGFSGGDNSPTLQQFQQYVADGQVRYFLTGEPFGMHREQRDGAATQITEWVQQHFTAVDVDGVQVYDLQP
ncbi:ArnT family glycosyltransferase [Mycolicibacterium sp. A43C]